MAPPYDKIRVVLDTDANNELDDQHAIAYLLFSGDVFEVPGITVNRTENGGDIHAQAAEADRVVRLAGLEAQVPIIKGASGSFDEIAPHLAEAAFDGSDAVNFIIDQAHAVGDEARAGDQPHARNGRKLVLLPIGKLTNIALALEKDPSIAPKVRVVWLGSNYPRPGEYNQDNDEAALNYLLDADVQFEIVLVRYGEATGTAAVVATLDEIRRRMPGQGPRISEPVVGRNGGTFHTFGDYSVNLFENIDLEGDPPSRPLYDMAAVAIVKNPAWAKRVEIPAPILMGGKWSERPGNPRTIALWEHFDRAGIMRDFYARMGEPLLDTR